MGTIPPHIAITYQPKSVYELGKRGVPSARPSTTISPDTCKPMTQPLSPAAQAMLSAFLGATPTPGVQELAAALRAVADQPYEVPTWIQGDDYWTYRNAIESERERNRSIAAELEGLDG